MSAVWPTGCVVSLAGYLGVGDQAGIEGWIREHVGSGDGTWEDLAILLVSLASTFVDDDTRRLMSTSERIVYMPGDVDGEHVDRLAVLMLTMALNSDQPGILGVLAAVKDADDLASLCGALGALAGRAMRGPVVRIEGAL